MGDRIARYRQSINPPYTPKDMLPLGLTFFLLLLGVGVIVFFFYQRQPQHQDFRDRPHVAPPLPTSHQQQSITWPSVVDLTSSSATYTGLAGSGSTVHAAFGDGTLYYRRSLDQGVSWQPWQDLGHGTLYLEDPIAVDGSIVGIVTVDASEEVTDFFGPRLVGNIFIRISRDNGATWEAPRQLTTNAKALRVSLAINGSTVHLTWMDYRTNSWEVRYLRSTDVGISWQPEVVLAPNTNIGAGRPSIGVSGNSVHAVWMDTRDGLPPCIIEGGPVLPFCSEIYYRHSTDSGATWEPAKRLTNDEPYSGRPDISVKGSTLVIAYDHRVSGGQNDIGLLHSNDSGETWTQFLLVTALGDQTHASPVSGKNGFSLVWIDGRSGSDQLYYRSSADGLTWSAEELVPSSNEAGAPGVGVTEGFVHVAWTAPNMKYARREL